MFAMIIYALIAGVVEKVVWLILYHPIEPVTLNRETNLNQMSKNDDRTLTR
jgi:hypothetical protein